ncbi:MAG: GHKL domain-containing protein [Bacteroidetes bacterium]|nr:GHKL domain-containing protein [Bacteroidota bacterium]
MRSVLVLSLLLLTRVATFSQYTFSPLLNYYKMSLPGMHSVFCVMPIRSGALLIGGSGGVVEYDGHQFKLLLSAPEYDMAEDSDGQIYVAAGTSFGVLKSDAQGAVFVESFSQHLPDSINVRFAATVRIANTKVFFVSFQYIYEVDKRDGKITVYPLESKKGAYNYGFTVGDSLFVSNAAVGLLIAHKGSVTKAPHGDFFKGHVVHSAIRQNNGTFILGWKELFEYTPSDKVPPKPIHLNRNNEQISVSSYYAKSTAQSHLHLHWWTQGGATLTDLDHNVLYEYKGLPGLAAKSAHSIGVDQQKNYWIAHEDDRDGTLIKISSERDLFIAEMQVAFTIRRLKDLLYVGASEGLFYVDTNKVIHKVEGVNDIQFSMAQVEVDGMSKLLVSSLIGLSEVVGNGLVPIERGSQSVAFMLQSKVDPHRVYVAGQARFYSIRYQNNKWIDEGKITDAFGKPMEEPDGTVWIPDRKRLIRYQPQLPNKPVTVFDQQHGLTGPCGSPFMIHGQVVLGTGNGFYTFEKNKNRFIPWIGFGALANSLNPFKEIQKVNDSTFYLIPVGAPSNTVQCTITKSGEVRYDTRQFKRLTNLGTVRDSWLDHDGTLWLCGDFGLIMCKHEADRKDYQQKFNCLIRKVKIGADSIPFYGGLALGEANTQNPVVEYKNNRIAFDFAAPFFDKEEETLYSYRLQGMGDGWSEWDKMYYKEYTNVYEGKYEFQVKAKNIYGVESTVATYSFTVLPPWYRTWWAYTLFALLVTLCITVLIRQRTKNINRRRKELEATVQHQTRELKANNEELRSINENLVLTQQKLIASEKMASLGQLTAGIAHEINNPINFISGGVQALSELQHEVQNQGHLMTKEELADKNREIEDLMNSIIKGVHRTSDIIKSLRQFSSPNDELNDSVSTDIKECISSSLLIINSKLKEANIQVQTRIEVQSQAQALSSQINQVLVNLISNSIDALLQRSNDRLIHITAEETKREIVIRVFDNGSGIPAEKQSHIFEPFFTTKPVGKGIGLGLFISYSIVQRHGGSLTFKSSADGTVFTLSLLKKRD